MKRFQIGLVLAALHGASLFAGAVSHSPRELGAVVLREWSVRDGKVVIRVDSGGCTDKASIRARVEQGEESLDNKPRYLLTFERVRIDECKALLLDGTELEYDLVSDLGILGRYSLSVRNQVKVFRPGEDRLKRALISSTAKAIELEIRGNEEKLKVAGPNGNAETFKARIVELKGQLATFKGVKLDAYQLTSAQEPSPGDALTSSYGPLMPPRKLVITADIDKPCQEGSLLKVETSRSGPFYHLAGGDYGSLKPGRTYELTVYLVYKREYFALIPDYYVHIVGAK